jgi:hypothetical protein
MDHFEALTEVVVEREGKEVKIDYWPRAFEVADSWVMAKVEEG